MLDLDELKKVRELIGELSAIGTKVTMRDSTGIITLELLNNIISTFEEIAAEREELDALMFEEEGWFVLQVSKGNSFVTNSIFKKNTPEVRVSSLLFGVSFIFYT